MISSVVDQSSSVYDENDRHDAILDPASSQLRALDIHLGDQAALSTQEDAERVRFGDPFALEHMADECSFPNQFDEARTKCERQDAQLQRTVE